MDIYLNEYNEMELKQYIYGSAEAVGLMCLAVFTNGNKKLYEELKDYAIKLGSAFQKVNFLRDLRYDNIVLNRRYFNNLDLKNISQSQMQMIIDDIKNEFDFSLKGIKRLPPSAKLGVFVAYLYYKALLNKIKKTPIEVFKTKRIRISNLKKLAIALITIVKNKIFKM
ncbi:MAG: squalene/phytoene synthase family protein [Candidatus Kryptonium sp.]